MTKEIKNMIPAVIRLHVIIYLYYGHPGLTKLLVDFEIFSITKVKKTD